MAPAHGRGARCFGMCTAVGVATPTERQQPRAGWDAMDGVAWCACGRGKQGARHGAWGMGAWGEHQR